jgi:hypothetical protein
MFYASGFVASFSLELTPETMAFGYDSMDGESVFETPVPTQDGIAQKKVIHPYLEWKGLHSYVLNKYVYTCL